MGIINITYTQTALALVAGILPLTVLPILPDSYQCIALFCLACIAGYLPYRSTKLFCIALLGLLWATANGNQILQQTRDFSGGRQQVVARIESPFLQREEKHNVLIALKEVNGVRVFPPLAAKVSSEGFPQGYCAGQRWLLTMSLRPVHSQLNLGGFDGQRWAVANRQTLSGRINSAERITAGCSLRQQIISDVQRQITTLDNMPVLLALAFGERGLISKPLSQLYKVTGTAHLMAISGLHIGVAALIGWLLARATQFLLPLRWIDYRFPLIVSWLAMLFYTWLSGVNPPAMRAALAISLWQLLKLCRLRCTAWQVWSWGVALLMVSDPLSILSDSFWLSCFAVAGLIFWFQWVPLPSRYARHWYWAWVRWGHLQAGMTLLLLPMQIGIFHGLSSASFFANLWAVPIVSLFTVPLVLAALFLTPLPYDIAFPVTQAMWTLADISLDWVEAGLNKAENYWLPLGENVLIFSLTGWLGIIIWRMGWIKTYPMDVIALCGVMLLWRQSSTRENWRVDMLDVGHGLAVLIEKNGRGVLYDTGNRWETGSQAQMQILPYLQWRNIVLDQIIVSHSHMDHNGGTKQVRAAFPSASLRTSFKGNLPCVKGQRWRWQELDFEVLWPPALKDHAGNDDSCVVRVSDNKFSVLLTGDIERAAETVLVKQSRARLQVNLLQVPHHGSNTSSFGPFLRASGAEVAIASASRYNVWRLPAQKIKNRYRENEMIWHDTSRAGQLSAFFFNNYWVIKGLRDQLVPRWYHQWFGVRGDNA
ncbi:ComEC family protein [Rouxiella badensis]|jgi:competence protein ComEC|uniref:ComEC family protein n=1 Tax=Rouxiella badensis TaxID=1646377 RepID=A0A1X0WE10_9GAMM|nr:ComEC family protein [Rouxiella badensis]MCC3701125.1 ComEC family protein [Rouxiella badensis]MCC3745816.1 ComEC family protein [Rouxiella badensis]ORJ24981.1 ComEC family protein [Rouxiella badensis]